MTKHILPIAALLSLPAFANAQENLATDNGFYIGVQYSQATYEDDIFNDRTDARSVLAGYRLLDGRLAVEVARTEADLSQHGALIENELNSARALYRALRIDNVSIIAGAGYHDVTSSLQLGGVSAESDDDWRSAIVGLEVDTAKVVFRIAAEKFFGLADDADARQYSLSASYRF